MIYLFVRIKYKSSNITLTRLVSINNTSPKNFKRSFHATNSVCHSNPNTNDIHFSHPELTNKKFKIKLIIAFFFVSNVFLLFLIVINSFL